MPEIEDFKFVCGCTPSIMDGTEYEYNIDDKIELPAAFSWKDVMPPVRNQCETSTCVCQSLTGMLDFITNSENGVANVCNNYNIWELYNTRENKACEGMTIKEALAYLKKHGLNGKHINGYAKVNSVVAACQAIVSQGPLAIGTLCYNNGMDKYWMRGGQNMGGHCVTLVGYDDEKSSFILRNSWGTSWASDGYILFPYDDFVNCCFECWTFLL